MVNAKDGIELCRGGAREHFVLHLFCYVLTNDASH